MPDYLKGTPEEALEFKPRSYICKRATMPLELNGRLDKPFWEKACWSDEFEDIEWEKKPKPYKKTRMKMLWDDEYLYVGAYLEEDKIWGTLKERDSVIFNDNDFEIFIDPDGDTHNYFEFEINTLNTVWDLLLTKPYRDNPKVINAWDITGLKSAVYIDGVLNDPNGIYTNKGWSIEIAFPFKILKECAKDNKIPSAGDYWRIDFSRVEWQTEIINGKYSKKINPKNGRPFPEDNWIWSPIGLINMHYPELWGFLYFTDTDNDNEKENFEIPKDEELKWELRKIYYMQRYFYANNGRYADKYEMLSDKAFNINSKIIIETTRSMYEAYIPTTDGKGKIIITHDGQCYIEN
ncbi:MAG: carbohydrate-binding family 9-like protein [Clostridia bacterium]|nr:carbohydrate-binding family 9-like protein [Clostridia bacterium]